MAREEFQVLSLVRGKRTTIYHTIALGKSDTPVKKRLITAVTSGAWTGMSVKDLYGSAKPDTFETYQAVTKMNWNATTGEIVVVVGSNEKYNNKSGMNLVTGFAQDLILVWNPATNAYEGKDKDWITKVTSQIASSGPDVEYRVNEASDCVISVGGFKHESYNLKGGWFMRCKLFKDDPLTVGP